MTTAQVHTLASLRLPAEGNLRRTAPKGCDIHDDGFWDRYDTHTLIYDCVYDAAAQKLHLTIPKPLNLRTYVPSAVFHTNDKRLTFHKWHRARHHDTITLTAESVGDRLHCKFGPTTAEIPIHHVDTSLTGQNVLYTMSRNNRLDWIADWARYHVTQHGANAVVLCDNGSDHYTPEDIAQTLAVIDGLQAVHIVAAPLPFGPRGRDCTRVSDAKFLQTGLMNLCKRRFMAKARVILSIDVDELVVSPTGESIFDATAHSKLGHITFPGKWRHAQATPPTHANHIYVKTGEKPCPTKYAIRPTGPLGRFPMQVHALEKVNRKLFARPKRFHYLHCRSISTSWKSDRTPSDDDNLTVDPATQQVMAKAFGKTST